MSDSDSEKAMYEDTTARVKVNGRKVFSVRVGVHQASVLEALSFEKSEKACSYSYLMLMIMFCLQKQRLCC